MESVEKQIALLLERNDCVQVPEFGGFVLNARNAVFGAHSHELLSPGKAISFNRNLQMNDGLLCSHISTSQKMLYTDAQAYIAEKVREWKKTLSAGQVLQLENIGTLQQDSEKKWQFSPFSIKNFDIKAYGLSSLQLKPVEQQSYTQKLDKKIKQKTKAMPKGRRVWLQGAVYSTIAAASLILGFLVLDEIGYQYKLFDGNNAIVQTEQNSQPQEIQPEEQFAAGNPELAENAPDAEIIDNSANENVSPESTLAEYSQPETNTETYSSSKYYVIGGAFSSTKNAKNFAQQLTKKGYNAEVLNNENGLTRVAYIVESDSLSADQQLQKIKLEENQAAWLLKW